MKTLKQIAVLSALALSFTSCEFIDDYQGSGGGKSDKNKKPLIIAHRGAQSIMPCMSTARLHAALARREIKFVMKNRDIDAVELVEAHGFSDGLAG